MSTARKRAFNNRSMSPDAHNRAIAAIQILWKQMRPDLFDKDELRDERLAWIERFLQLRRPLASITDLSDKQLGVVLEEMRRMTGTVPKQTIAAPLTDTNVVQFPNVRRQQAQPAESETVHLAGEQQIFTINKLVGFIGWSEEGFRDFLFQKFRRRSPRLLKFKECNSLMMILLNIAADKDLRAQGKAKISRAMTAKHIPEIKRRLEIDR
jgi:hypothetical protein